MRKNAVRALAFILVACALCTCLVSCGKKVSGKYTAQIGGDLLGYTATYNFSGSKVTVTKTATVLGQASTTEIKGTYEITENDNGMEISFTFETDDDDIKSGKVTFDQGKTEDGVKYIKLGGIQYTEAK